MERAILVEARLSTTPSEGTAARRSIAWRTWTSLVTPWRTTRPIASDLAGQGDGGTRGEDRWKVEHEAVVVPLEHGDDARQLVALGEDLALGRRRRSGGHRRQARIVRLQQDLSQRGVAA